MTIKRKVMKNYIIVSVNFNEKTFLQTAFEKKIVNLQVEVIEMKEL